MYKKIFHFQEIETAINNIDLNSMVIFDVDDVLIQPKDEALKIYNVKNFSNLFNPIKDNLNEKQSWELESIIISQSQYELVCKDICRLIGSLQNKGIRVLALTQLFTGTFGLVKSLEDWRISILQRFELNFRASWQGVDEKIFTNIPSIQHPDFYPLYKEGVLFTCDRSKGEVLGEFLEFSKIYPNNIVMFDDKVKHLESVSEYSSSNDIDFQGFNFLAAYPKQKIDFDFELASYQLNFLLDNKVWLSDLEAKDKMSGGAVDEK